MADLNNSLDTLLSSRNAKPRDASQNLTAEDSFNYSPYTEEQASAGALPQSTYFPGSEQNINVGTYSGSVVGSNPIFVNTGGYIPFGMHDARQKAINDAAAARVKADDDFYQKIKTPVTKLNSVQAQLEEEFNAYVNNEVADAKKRYGKQWESSLRQKPQFWQKIQSFNTIAAFHDDISGNIATTQKMEDKGYYVPEELKKANEYALGSMAKLRHSTDAGTEQDDMYGTVMKQKVYTNYTETLNKGVKGAKAYIEQRIQDDVDKGIWDMTKTLSEKTYPQEESIANQMVQYYGGSGIPEAQIRNDVRMALQSEIKETFKSNRNQFGPPSGYGRNQQVEETEFNNEIAPRTLNIRATGKGGATREASTSVYHHTDLATKRPVSISSGTDVYYPSQGNISKVPSGKAIDYDAGAVFVAPTMNGQIFQDNWMYDNKKDLSYTEYAKAFNADPDNKGKHLDETPSIKYEVFASGTDEKGKEVWTKANAVKNSLTNDVKKSGITYKGVDLTKWQNEADRLTRENKNEAEPKKAAAASTSKSIKISLLKSKIGTKGYEGYTEKELIDYYTSQGYTVQ